MSEEVEEIPKVSIEIDGQELQVEQGSMIIEAADDAEIVIPRFCYHKKLSVAANCRMCLVELKDGRKPMPACATPVSDGMVIYTKSQKALEYQKTVMEFLLINHPLDCPICDQGGECELQDVAMGYGKDVSRYTQGKRSVPEKDIGPLIATDLIRCIHCTRCVRFGIEIAGQQELGMTHRGEHSEIDTFLDGNMESELSGNVIDLCPVGALTSKPYRFKARPWELQQFPSIAPHDCIGSNIFAHVRRGECLRVVPRENEKINEVWLSDRDRFSYEALNVEHRATDPMIKRDGEWEKVEWEEAFEYVVGKLQKTHADKGPESIAALASASSTTEEFYLLQKLMRSLGCNNLDFRLRQNDFSNQTGLAGVNGIDIGLDEIDGCDHVLMVGGNVRINQPILNHRIRKSTTDQDDSTASSINPHHFHFHCRRQQKWLVDNDEMPAALTQVVKAVLESKGNTPNIPGLKALLSSVTVSEDAKKISDKLLKAECPAIFMGQLATSHYQAGLLIGLMQVLKDALGARGGLLTNGANTKGACQAGFLPMCGPGGSAIDNEGRHAKDLLSSDAAISAYFLLNLEPGYDSVLGETATKALKQADMVVAMTPFVTNYLSENATVILPVNAFAETSGRYSNVTGETQTFQAVSRAPGQSRPAWKVIRVLANFMKKDGFDFVSSEEVAAELDALVQPNQNLSVDVSFDGMSLQASEGYQIIRPVPTYGTDMLVRQAPALQETNVMKTQVQRVQISEVLAKKLGVTEDEEVVLTLNGQSVTSRVRVGGDIAPNTVSVYQAVAHLLPLAGDGKLELKKA